MGIIQNHAIIVTGYDPARVAEARAVAAKFFDQDWNTGGPIVSNVVGQKINGGASFFVGPDGSKEGWSESEQGDKIRALFIAWLEAQLGYLKYVEVSFGETGTGVTAANTAKGEPQ